MPLPIMLVWAQLLQKRNSTVDSGAVLFSGTVGALPDSGAGTRFMWIPNQAAVRFGEAVGNEWNAARIGKYSFAGGWGSYAENPTSFAFGEGCFVTGTFWSFSMLHWDMVAWLTGTYPWHWVTAVCRRVVWEQPL